MTHGRTSGCSLDRSAATEEVIREEVLCILAFAHCCLMAVVSGCHSGKTPATAGVRAEQLVGKWRVVRVDERPPAELSVNSEELDIGADGKWTSRLS